MTDRYQEPGVMPTSEWFAALRRGIDGPLGDVLDVGCAEGVMCRLALEAGANSALGIDSNPERIAVASNGPGEFMIADALGFGPARYRTVIMSQIIHWLGASHSLRFFMAATRNLAIVFRLANDHYAIPENGVWFPTLTELDAMVGGVRTSETHLMTQDNGKEIWAATYRTDLVLADGMVRKNGRSEPFHDGIDLHGDKPFRPTPDQPVIRLSGPNATAVRDLARKVAEGALADGTYPSDFSPRNVIVAGAEAWLIDDEPEERVAGTVVAEPFLPIWQATLSSIGLDFTGDLRSLL